MTAACVVRWLCVDEDGLSLQQAQRAGGPVRDDMFRAVLERDLERDRSSH